MSDNLSAMVRDLYSAVDAEQDPLSVDDALYRAGPVRPLPVDERRVSSTWRVPVVVAAAAAAAVLFLIGGLALLTQGARSTVAPPVIDQVEPEEPQIVDRIESEEPPVVEQEEPVPAPSTTLPPEPVEPTAPITGMAWQQITPEGIDPNRDTGMTALVSGGDRFLYFQGTSKAVSTSFDGINWTTRSIQGSVDGLVDVVGWQDTLVGTGCGGATSSGGGPITPKAGCVSVIHPDGTVARQSFDGDINGAGIGPSGMVVTVSNHHDENGLRYATEDVVAYNLTGRDINELRVFELTDGVLHIETDDGQIADYVLSEHGYAGIEPPFASGWFSQDGEEWIPIPDLPPSSRWDLVGTEDGFVGISDNTAGALVAWHSSNGLDWRELGELDDGWTLTRWSDGAIGIGPESVWYLSGLGISKTPLTTIGLEPLITTSGNVGVVIVDFESETGELNQILYSPNGQAWTRANVPPEVRDLELTIDAYHGPIGVVATDNNVMLVLNEASEGEEGSTLVWFLGTPITD